MTTIERRVATVDILQAAQANGQQWVTETEIAYRVGLQDLHFIRRVSIVRVLKKGLGFELDDIQTDVGEGYLGRVHATLGELGMDGLVKEDWIPNPASPQFPQSLRFHMADFQPSEP